MSNIQYLRRAAAGAYLKTKYGVGSARTLAKLAVIGGGPEMRYIGRLPVYTIAALDEWAQSKISGPRRSTSDPGSGNRTSASGLR
jgi:hypothetical protein